MNILCISDLHGWLPIVEDLPEADLMLLGGDLCHHKDDERWYTTTFASWLEQVGQRMQVVGVSGNHDVLFERKPTLPAQLPWTYLCDSGCEVNGLKIWGTPHQPTFGVGWAFNLDERSLAGKWQLIPEDTDILLLHGPPYGFGDFSPYGRVHTGSPSLTERIKKIRPRLVVNGHIHSGYGVRYLYDMTIVNAAHVDERYNPVNNPVLIRDIHKKTTDHTMSSNR